jgi:hypothetical protein
MALADGIPRLLKVLVYPVEFESRTVPTRFLLVRAPITCLIEWVCSIRIATSENEMPPSDTRTTFGIPYLLELPFTTNLRMSRRGAIDSTVPSNGTLRALAVFL